MDPTSPTPAPLPPARRSSRGVATSLLILLVTGMLLLRHDLRPSTRAMLVGSHIILGVATATFGLRSLLGLFRMRVREFPLGMGLVLCSGLLLLGFGADRKYAWLVAAHALIATVYAVSQLVPRRVAYLGAPILGLLLMWMSHERTEERRIPLEPLPPPGAVQPLASGPVVDNDRLSVEAAPRFTDPGRCTSCHIQVGEEHAAGPHRQSSVTNERFLAAARRVLDEEGPGAARRCAGCHAVGLLAHRKVEEGLGAGPAIAEGGPPGIDQGVPCLTCHGETRVRWPSGPGALSLALPDDPLVLADGIRHTLTFLVTYVDARSHRDQMMPRDGRSATRCGVCHQDPPGDEVTARVHRRAQTDRAEHRSSAFYPQAGPTGLLPLDRGPRSCAGCHMGPAAGGHRMATPPPSDVEEEERDDEDGPLEPGPPAPQWTASWLRPQGGVVRPQDGLFRVEADQAQPVHLLVTTEGVGHGLPGGTAPLDELDVEVELVEPGAPAAPLEAAPLEAERRPSLRPGEGAIWSVVVPPGPARELRLRARVRGEAPGARLARPVRLARYADAAARAGRPALAEAALTEAEREDPGHLEVRLARVRALLAAGDPVQAARMLATDDEPRARALRARALLEQGRPRDALTAIEDLLQTWPEDLGLLWWTARAQHALAADADALSTLEALLARRPWHHPALKLAAELSEQAGDAQRGRYLRARAAKIPADPRPENFSEDHSEQ